MALASNPLESFTWGAGGARMTPEEIARQREIAAALTAKGVDTSPVGHWTQGLARVVDAIGGAVNRGQADRAEASNTTANSSILQSLLQGGTGGFPAAPTSAFPTAPAASGGGQAASSVSAPQGVADGIRQTAEALGIDPIDLGTAISYETAGTFDPMKKGPTTQWGQHRGLIQFGEPQAAQNGVDWSNPVGSQLGPDGAVAKYLRAAGVKPGMGLLDVYSAINAGGVGKYGASDANNGGAPGTVRDKVEKQMAAHRAKALALLGGDQVASNGGSEAIAQALSRAEAAGWQVAAPPEFGQQDVDRLRNIPRPADAVPYSGPGATIAPGDVERMQTDSKAREQAKLDANTPPWMLDMIKQANAGQPVTAPQPGVAQALASPVPMQPGPLASDPVHTAMIDRMTGKQPMGGQFQGVEPSLRPFNPGERRPNPDGSYSTEISTTQQQPDGQYVNTPSLWMGKQGSVQFNPNDEQGIMSEAQRYEAQNGQTFARFPDVQSAEQAAVARSAAGGAGAGAPQGGQPAPDNLPVMAGGSADAIPAGQAQQGINPAIIEALSNPAASEQTRKIAGMLLGQQMQSQDPANQLDMKYKQAQIDALGAKAPKEWVKLDDNTLFNSATGETKQTGTGVGGQFKGTALEAQAWNILQTADPSSKEYATAYSIVSQPRNQMVQTDQGQQIIAVPPQLPAWLTPPGAGGPAAPTGAGAAPGAVPAPTSAPGAAGGVIPGTKKPPTEQQSRNGAIGHILLNEVPTLGKTFSALADPKGQFLSLLGPLGNPWQSEEYQRAAASVTASVANVLYSLSGSSSNPGEVVKQIEVLTPKFGDKPGAIKDKLQRFKTYVRSVSSEANDPDLTKMVEDAISKMDAPDQQTGDLPEGVTEEDIQHTMKLHGVSREEVLKRLSNAP